MKKKLIHTWLNYSIAAVWIVNGLFCKVLNLVPRHQEIVARILDIKAPALLTISIGLAEIGMAIWILSGIRPRLNAITQIIVIAIMNSLEFFIAPDLLLWGKANAIFAFMFIVMIYFKEFYLSEKINQEAACYHS
jgi:hypothetical protein